MTVFKCKMCGGSLDVNEAQSVAVCEYCGTKQTLPRLDDSRRANLYDRANHFRRNNDFDKAMAIYETILNEDGTDAEAYWSIVLCRYGIEYVEDPATHKRIPTVNRAQFTSIFDDEDYRSALANADPHQREIYEAEAEAINEIQKGILSISQKEEPFDVFICYKETDASGRRTQDSVLATELYHELTREGFKVFFSRITLEDKIGAAYEPYIFAALNSAKVMVVLGTKPEYFNAVWVKNEWSRFLALIRAGARKTLVPAYRDMDPYDLPEEFSHLQAQDMSKLGFMQDLTRGIKKLVEADAPVKTEKEAAPQAVPPPATTVPLLKRAYMALEDGEFDRADGFCEQALNQDPECAEAYVGKLMAALHVKQRADLAKLKQPFDKDGNYQKAVRFADADLAAELEKYLSASRKEFEKKKEEERLAAEEARKEALYNRATYHYASHSIAILETALQEFTSLAGYKDSEEFVRLCQEKIIREKNASIERERQAKERVIALKEAEKHKKKMIAVTSVIVLAVLVFVILLSTVIIPSNTYNTALALINDGKYKEAISTFQALGEYKDSPAKAEECTRFLSQADGLENLAVGNTIMYGYYEQDNYTKNSKEEIAWLVLAVEENRALVISKYALDCIPYNATYTDVTWENCTIRTWLNDTFFNEAFSTIHQRHICSTPVSADKNPDYSTDPGIATTDRVFLLSIDEARQYFDNDEARKCVPTTYAIVNGAYTSNSYSKSDAASCWWWLRSPGYVQDLAAGVDLHGAVYSRGSNVYCSANCVRPAMWITLDV